MALPTGLLSLLQESIPAPLQDTLAPFISAPLDNGNKVKGYSENTVLFGFNKMGVALTAECDLDMSLGEAQLLPIHCVDSLQVLQLNLQTVV
jgi:hypothetical protein